MEDRHGGLWALGGMQEAKRARTIGVDDDVQIDPPHALEVADLEGILTQQFARAAGFDVPFPEGGILLLDELDLLGTQLNGLRRLGAAPA